MIDCQKAYWQLCCIMIVSLNSDQTSVITANMQCSLNIMMQYITAIKLTSNQQVGGLSPPGIAIVSLEKLSLSFDHSFYFVHSRRFFRRKEGNTPTPTPTNEFYE